MTSHLFYQSRLQRPELDRAEGIYLWDTSGKRYLDGSSGAMVSNIGHSNPAVLAAMRAQMDKATFGYRLHFQTEASEALAAQTAALCPEGMNRVFFVSGGSEAVESAIKFARSYKLAVGEAQRFKVISRTPSYHGSTFGALAVTGYAPLAAPFDPMMRAMPKIPAPRAYLDGLDADDPATGLHYANMLEEKILSEGQQTVLAFIVEPVGGASTGALVPPAGYMQRIREICDTYGVLLIHDEVMSGGGRTGRFWGAAHWDTVPDVIAISKGFGGGYVPLGAMIARDDMVEAVLDKGGFAHGHTYAGNPLACAAGSAVLGEIERLDLVGNAAQMGAALKARLGALMTRYSFIGDVRGKGLLLAFELVMDRASMEPLPKEWNAYDRLVNIAYEAGLIIYSRRTRGGMAGDHFLVCPPMIVDEAGIDEIIDGLTRSLDRFADEMGLDRGARRMSEAVDVHFREARPEDADAVADMLGRLAKDLGAGRCAGTNAEDIRTHGFGPGSLFETVVAVMDEELVGIALIFKHFSTLRGCPGVYIQDLWVTPGLRNRNLGFSLLNEVARLGAVKWGARYVQLSVARDNPSAERFYRRLGFVAHEGEVLMTLECDGFDALGLGEVPE